MICLQAFTISDQHHLILNKPVTVRQYIGKVGLLAPLSYQLKLFNIQYSWCKVCISLVNDLIDLDLQVHVVLLLNVYDEVDARDHNKREEYAKYDRQIKVKNLWALLLEKEILGARNPRGWWTIRGGTHGGNTRRNVRINWVVVGFTSCVAF